MEKIEIRPRFRYDSPLSPPQLLSNLQQALDAPDAPVNGLIVDQHVYLRIPYDQQHFWSPQLSIEIEAREEGSLASGFFGPRESVWLMYLFFYAFLGFSIMVVSIMGFSQLNLGLSARILWALPVLIILLLLAYLTAKTGQKLGRDEMQLLYRFFTDTVDGDHITD